MGNSDYEMFAARQILLEQLVLALLELHPAPAMIGLLFERNISQLPAMPKLSDEAEDAYSILLSTIRQKFKQIQPTN